ncbi:extracellular solute-binding protein [Paenibacillus sp. PR3]|uniref:Extracellular solute-binding protein n=1 Tax=Paenibacillus terricola TaxID=2763503 RepID=A0ABR8N3A5_9BACL|nr:extracellular solute-binding protein [Paenibacillus terricola]MBD3920929.1 extracellular solute-binding protein [Paenibacillus terricola]
MRRRRLTIALLLSTLLLPNLQACTSTTDELDVDDKLLEDDSNLNLDPNPDLKLTLRWYGNNARELRYGDEVYFDKIRQKFPNIEIERYEEFMDDKRLQPTGSEAPWPMDTLTDMLSAHQEPDIIVAYTELIPKLSELGLLSDMEEYVSANKLDLSRFEPAFIEQVRSYSPDGQLLAVPYMRTLHAMSYNKVWFDKAHIPYPTDGMTWEEWMPWAANIKKKYEEMNVGSTLIYAVSHAFGYPLLALQRSASILDADTGKANVTNADWTAIARIMQIHYGWIHTPFEVYNGPSQPYHNTLEYSTDGYELTYKFINSIYGEQYFQQSDWDMVSFPTFEDKPGIGPDFVGEVLSVNPNSEHREEAFEVLSYLVSDEFQTWNARLGNGSPLADPAINAQFAVDNLFYSGKNVRAFFHNQPAKPAKKNAKEPKAEYMMNGLMDGFYNSSNLVEEQLYNFEEKWNNR